VRPDTQHPRSGSGHGREMVSNSPEPAQAKTAAVRPVASRAHGGSFYGRLHRGQRAELPDLGAVTMTRSYPACDAGWCVTSVPEAGEKTVSCPSRQRTR